MTTENKELKLLGPTIAGFGSVALFVISLIVFVQFIGCDTTYSEGHRDGVLQKFSHQGIFVTSHEGELALPGFRVRGESTSNTFEFSVDDAEIIEQLESLPAETPIRVHYRQVFKNARMRHATSYRATKIEIFRK